MIAGAALALFGLIRFTFNAVGVRVFGPEYIGAVGSRISSLTLIAVLLASVPSVLATKFIAEFCGAGQQRRAEQLFSGVVVATAFMGTAAALALVLLGPPGVGGILMTYVPLYGLYLVLKGAYFAFR